MVYVNSKKLCKYELIISIDIAGTWIKYLPLLSFCNNHNLAVFRRMYDKLHTKKATDRTMCSVVDSASKNEYRGFLLG